MSKDCYGDSPIIQSTEKTGVCVCVCVHTFDVKIDKKYSYQSIIPIAPLSLDRKWAHIRELVREKVGQKFLVRARVHTRRGAGEC